MVTPAPMERPRDPFDLVVGLREDVTEVKQDVRRLDDRIFQLMLLQVGTLAATVASILS